MLGKIFSFNQIFISSGVNSIFLSFNVVENKINNIEKKDSKEEKESGAIWSPDFERSHKKGKSTKRGCVWGKI